MNKSLKKSSLHNNCTNCTYQYILEKKKEEETSVLCRCGVHSTRQPLFKTFAFFGSKHTQEDCAVSLSRAFLHL